VLRRKIAAGLVLAASLLAATQTSAHAYTAKDVDKKVTVTGAGATFPLNIIEAWKADYKKATGATINYAGVGSGAGRTQLINGTVDFAGSDVVASADETKKLKAKYGDFVYVPETAGAVAIIYNVKGIGAGLKLTADDLGKIFAGRLNFWDDPMIKNDNPDLDLPHTIIQPFVRSDKSGTTGVFTGYLKAASTTWDGGETQQFPINNGQIGKSGSDGVANSVKATDSSIGYAEVSFAKERGINMATVRNGAGTFEVADREGTKTAIDQAKINADGSLTLDFTTKAAGAYPISTVSYFLVPTKMDAKKGQNLKVFINYCLGKTAQGKASSLNYSAVPERVLTIARTNLQKVNAKK
jgi:phosphate transport system substrate-binding protein